MGREFHLIDPQKVARYQDQMARSYHYNYDGKTEWVGSIRMLDERDIDYANQLQFYPRVLQLYISHLGFINLNRVSVLTSKRSSK